MASIAKKGPVPDMPKMPEEEKKARAAHLANPANWYHPGVWMVDDSGNGLNNPNGLRHLTCCGFRYLDHQRGCTYRGFPKPMA